MLCNFVETNKLGYLLISIARIVMLCQENSSLSSGLAVMRAPVVMST